MKNLFKITVALLLIITTTQNYNAQEIRLFCLILSSHF